MHSLIGMYVDKMRFVNHEGRTNYALIPFANVYLLGKYAVDVLLGIVLFVGAILAVDFSVTLFDVKYGYAILADTLRHIIYLLYFIAVVCVLVYTGSKYARITNHTDKIDIDDIIYYIKETLWIIIFCIAVYLFAMFIVGVGTGVISIWYNFFILRINLIKVFDL